MKKILILIITSVLLGGCVGGNDSDYAIDRKRDFNDIFTYGLGGGAKVQAGPFSGGFLIFQSAFGNKKIKCKYYTNLWQEKYIYDSVAWARNKQYLAVGIGFLYPIADNQFVSNYYTQFEVGAGCIIPGPYLGFNPGELLDWSLGYYGIDIYGDDIGLPPTYEQDLKDLNKFFAEHNGNLSMTNKEQTVICHERERCRVYQFENYSLAVFPLYWQKYGVHDFILFLHNDKKENVAHNGCKDSSFKAILGAVKNKPLVGFNNYFLNKKYPGLIKRQEKYRRGTLQEIFFKNNKFEMVSDENDSGLYEYHFSGFIKKEGGTNHIFKNLKINIFYPGYFEFGDPISSKTIKITLPVNKIK